MITLFKNMLKSKGFVRSMVASENITCHLLKVLMMKCGYNKILMSIVKLILVQLNLKKKQNNLRTIILNYKNKYGSLYLFYYYIISVYLTFFPKNCFEAKLLLFVIYSLMFGCLI